MLLLLFLLFIVVPIAELYVIIQVGQAIGVLADDRAAAGGLDPRLDAAALAGPRACGGASTGAAQRAGRRRARCSTARSCMFGGALLLTPGLPHRHPRHAAAAAADARPGARGCSCAASPAAWSRRDGAAPARGPRPRGGATTSRARRSTSTRRPVDARPRASAVVIDAPERPAADGSGFADAVTSPSATRAALVTGWRGSGAGRRTARAARWPSSSGPRAGRRARARRAPCADGRGLDRAGARRPRHDGRRAARRWTVACDGRRPASIWSSRRSAPPPS